MTAPVLHTARLTLRPPVMEDFPTYAAFLAGGRSGGVGGPLDTKGAWAYFTSDVALWPLQGFGALMMEKDGQLVGSISLNGGPLFPETEIGWMVYDGHEGQGYAPEAASVVRDWALGPRGLATLVSYVGRDNAPSRRVAEKLGAAIDPQAVSMGSETLVYRHRRPA
jgi:RimJ/RimL family protein N-acetyltransferase